MSDEHNKIELPAPTCWPIVSAFGLVLCFAGLVTSLIVTAVGLLIGLVGAVGWFRDVFPHPKHEYVDRVPHPERAMAVTQSHRIVEHLAFGEAGHRLHLPVAVHPYLSGVKGGLAGGFVMAILACAWGFFRYHSIWYPVNLLAAAGVPELALASVATLIKFSVAGLIVGTVTHVSISILVGLLYVVILPMLPARFEWFWGGIITPILWTGLVAASLRLVNPALAQHVDWPWFIFCQVAFGLVGGYVVFKSEKIETIQHLSLAAKLGVEAQHKDPAQHKNP
jgi:hypothetical protein